MNSPGREPRGKGKEKERKAAERRKIPGRHGESSHRVTGQSPLRGSVIYGPPLPGAHAPGYASADAPRLAYRQSSQVLMCTSQATCPNVQTFKR